MLKNIVTFTRRHMHLKRKSTIKDIVMKPIAIPIALVVLIIFAIIMKNLTKE